jgi:hypothetical protein
MVSPARRLHRRRLHRPAGLQAYYTTAAASASPAGDGDDDDDGEPALNVAFSVAINGAAGGEARALWASERFAASSPVALRVQLLVQLLNEVLALSPFVPCLGGDAPEAVVVGAAGADPSAPAAAAFFSIALMLRFFWLCALDAPADAGYLFFRDLGAEIERGLVACRRSLAVFLRSVGPDVEGRFMRSLGYMLAKWCLLREIQAAAAVSSPAAPRRRCAFLAAACLSYATEVHASGS